MLEILDYLLDLRAIDSGEFIDVLGDRAVGIF